MFLSFLSPVLPLSLKINNFFKKDTGLDKILKCLLAQKLVNKTLESVQLFF